MCYASGHTLKNHTFVVGLCKCCVAFREEAHSFFEPIFAQLHCVPATLSCRAAEGLGTWTRKLLRLKNNCLCWVIFQANQSPDMFITQLHKQLKRLRCGALGLSRSALKGGLLWEVKEWQQLGLEKTSEGDQLCWPQSKKSKCKLFLKGLSDLLMSDNRSSWSR